MTVRGRNLRWRYLWRALKRRNIFLFHYLRNIVRRFSVSEARFGNPICSEFVEGWLAEKLRMIEFKPAFQMSAAWYVFFG